MTETPKKKKGKQWYQRVKWKLAAPAAVFAFLVLYLIISLIIGLISGPKPSKKDIDITNICSYNGKQTLEALNKEDRSKNVAIKDYNFYGQSLNLYFDSYDVTITNSNTLRGKNVVLRNMCDGSEVVFEGLTRDVDNQIDLGKLKPGFYSVYIVENETYNRVYMSSMLSFNNTFTTITKDGKNMKVELVADKTMFTQPEAEEDYLDQHYLYIKVTEIPAEENREYDVAISVAPALTSGGVSLVGMEQNGIVEAVELFDVATDLKAKLEEAGLKVILLKETYDEDVWYYGSNGVLNRAYNSKAKILVHLDMEDYGQAVGVMYSYNSSGKLANEVYQSIKASTTLYADEMEENEYLLQSDYADDGYTDWVYEIREAGGKVLNAGTYSEASMTNASFAANNIYGMDTIVVMPCDITVSNSVSNFAQNKAALAKAIADGIINSLK